MTYICRFKVVDNGCFAAVVKAQAQHVDFFLPQAQPPRQFIQQTHFCLLTHQILTQHMSDYIASKKVQSISLKLKL